MPTWAWIVIAIGAVVVLLVVLFGATRARTRRLETKRGEARELRVEAKQRSRRAEEREALAEEQAQRAREERERAQEAAERARDVDPDRD